MTRKTDIPDNLRESPFGGLCCRECGKLLTIALAKDHNCSPKPPRKRVDVGREAFWG